MGQINYWLLFFHSHELNIKVKTVVEDLCLLVIFYTTFFSCLLQVQYYERLSPLVPMKFPLQSLSDVRNGDCIVTFSRRDIYKLKVNFYTLIIFLLEIREIYVENSFEHFLLLLWCSEFKIIMGLCL